MFAPGALGTGAALAIGVPVALLAYYVRRVRPANSELELMSDTRTDDYLEGRAVDLASSIGWPYYYGRGSPSTPWTDGPSGVDCSGYAQMCLVRLGLLSSAAPDRGAAALADDSDPVAVGDQQPGDLAYYPGHVVVVASYPGADGHSAVLSASGGGPTTFGNDPNARVKLFSTALYRGSGADGFVTYMRLKA